MRVLAKGVHRRLAAAALAAAFCLAPIAGEGTAADGTGENQWYKGQLHCHAENVGVPVVMQKYRDAGFDFVAVSNKNAVAQTSSYSSSTFLTIPNDELEFGWNHVCAINLKGGHPAGSPPTLKDVVDMALGAGGLPQINHPHLSGHTVDRVVEADGAVLLEVMQRYDSLQYDADLWDGVLSAGRRIFGTATDDAHDYTNDYNWGWVMVRAASLTAESILGALAAGSFYASTGPSIGRIEMLDRELTVTTPDGERIVFIGQDGAVLEESVADSATYRLPESQLYVRAVVLRGDGKRAYTQAYFPGPTGTGFETMRPAAAARGGGLAVRMGNGGNVIAYSVDPAGGQRVRLTIHALNGALVRTLVDRHLAAGTYRAVWDGTGDRAGLQGSGVYACRLEAGGVARSAVLHCRARGL